MSAALDLQRLETTSLVDLLLEEQQDLSAVERFAQRHDEAQGEPLQQRYYQDLIPTQAPGEGQQFAFRVDMDACTGCKACVTACHALNGLEEDETWRDVGLMISATDAPAFQQTVTTACHHCEDPGCMDGCPVLAYDKDPVTGIVRHLDDQCIGCQYCVMKCPYDVPKYSKSLGIVRKCDMCSDRLSSGEAPACVQGCPNGAIAIDIVEVGAPIADMLLPVKAGHMPASSYTRPTTRYIGQKSRAVELAPADLKNLRPADSHMPLAFMMVLSQLSLGVFVMDALAGGAAAGETLRLGWLALGLGLGLIGQAGAPAHIGRPQYAFRAFLGWRTSWMSREILVLVAYTLLSFAAVGATALPVILPLLPEGVFSVLGSWLEPVSQAEPLLLAAAIVVGTLGTYCSGMIYVDTHRSYWRRTHTLPRFFGTVFVLGPATALFAGSVGAVAGLGSVDPAFVSLCSALLVVATGSKLALELSVLRHLGRDDQGPLARSARLLMGPLRSQLVTRGLLGAVSGMLLPGALVFASSTFTAAATPGRGTAWLATAIFLGCLAAEMLERRLFFTSVAPQAMPGQG